MSIPISFLQFVFSIKTQMSSGKNQQSRLGVLENVKVKLKMCRYIYISGWEINHNFSFYVSKYCEISVHKSLD